MPTNAELFDQAVRCYQSGALGQAEPFLLQVLVAEPAHAQAHHLLGLLASQTGRPDSGVTHLRQACSLDPTAVAYRCNLGIALEMQGQHLEAIACFRDALILGPHYANARVRLANALNNRGILCVDQNQPAEARACFQEAVALNPGYTEAHNNLGNILKDEGHYAEAAACFEQALRLEPTNKFARWNRSIFRLLRGDLAGGWPDFELRWAMPGAVPPTFQEPRWDGSTFAGKTLLVYTEMGLGDTLQFHRYLPLVKERGGTVIFACQKALLQLLAGAPGQDRLVAAGTRGPTAICKSR